MLQLRAHFVEKLVKPALLEIVLLPGGALRTRIRADIAAVLFAVIVADKAISEELGKEPVLRVRNGILAPIQPLFIRARHEPPQVEHISAVPFDCAQEFLQIRCADGVRAHPEHLAQFKALRVQIQRLFNLLERAVARMRQIAQGHKLNGVFKRFARSGANGTLFKLRIRLRPVIERIDSRHS